MSSQPHVRLPISTRHAFALAFDLAVRRDFRNSLLVPLLLRAPWILANGAISSTDPARSNLVLAVRIVANLGDFLMAVLVGAMLRFRARSVFNTPVDVRPGAAIDAYAQGLRRVPWLIVTEIARNLAILLGSFFFVLPGLFLGFRLSFATEAVVLTDPTTESAFRHSFRLTEGRFERWLEMILASVGLAIGALIVATIALLAFRVTEIGTWLSVWLFVVAAITPVFQYAWTFFYLRLVEGEEVAPYEPPGPLYAGSRLPPPIPIAPVAQAVPPSPERPSNAANL